MEQQSNQKRTEIGTAIYHDVVVCLSLHDPTSKLSDKQHKREGREKNGNINTTGKGKEQTIA